MTLQSAIVTSSYRGDFERCRLLCESMDQRVSGHTRHLIMVEGADMALFRQLAGPKREIVDERDLLPRWLRPFPDPISLGRRRIWLTPKGPPLRGWHVQQLRRLAIAAALDETVVVSVDSDVVFLRAFDLAWFHRTGAVNFYSRPNAIAHLPEPARSEQGAWSLRAGQMLGIETPAISDAGYIATLIAWRSDTVRDMQKRIEAVSGRSWMSTLVRRRALSECILYGRFVDEVENRPDRHARSALELCHMYWDGAALNAAALADFSRGLEPHQVAAGIQSFTGTDPALIRRAVGLS
ncbi:DUF6492 family protein [Aurantimonas sp. A2-1-M11]|uniref:DUF6492 family protein n=1 Tax=Aurantimonas sp. A2-1-M11 TaxID=3113712 RepID=UPI002F91FC92